jgi:hypothetical protein
MKLSITDRLPPEMRPTPGPWEHGDNGIIYGQCGQDDVEATFVCDVIEDTAMQALGMLSSVEAANARRIVAAVNACAGIPTDALEQGVVRELLQALAALYNWLTPDWQQSSLANQARAALLKANAIHQPTIERNTP